jgi:membrane-bound ClpP family serine protease
MKIGELGIMITEKLIVILTWRKEMEIHKILGILFLIIGIILIFSSLIKLSLFILIVINGFIISIIGIILINENYYKLLRHKLYQLKGKILGYY